MQGPQATILVADDDAISTRLICDSLSSLGHRILTAADGEQACQMVEQAQPDLVLSDWMMPQLDGLGLLARIRSRPEWGNPYFILLTVKWRPQDRVSGLDSGADDYLVKPFEPEELQARVRAGLRIIGLRRSLEKTVAALEEKARILEEDLKAAERAQRALLPKNLPELSGIQFRYRFLPCHFVSGDSLNVVRLNEDNLGIYMLDVCGHGVQAVMTSVSIHRILTPDLNTNSPLKRSIPEPPFYRLCGPAEVIAQLNADATLSPSMEFFTLFYAVLNHRTRELVYSRAGHLPPLVLGRAGTTRWLEEGGMPIGIESSARWREGTLTLAAGDRLLIYSDGVVELRDQNRRALGLEGLEQLALQTRTLPLGDQLSALESGAQAYYGQTQLPDDFSLLALEVPN